ncbi:hypothetical protein CLOM621_07582 [Clostridium sp. M62/1]|nr:hypothetical protein CLOM621_07582 [Clostridium sp. M62/1]
MSNCLLSCIFAASGRLPHPGFRPRLYPAFRASLSGLRMNIYEKDIIE